MRSPYTAILLVVLSACSLPTTQDHSIVALKKQFAGILSPRVQLADDSKTRNDDLWLILEIVQQAKANGKSFDAITRIEFVSNVRATVSFTWSGGFHGGFFKVVKKGATWKIAEEEYLM